MKLRYMESRTAKMTVNIMYQPHAITIMESFLEETFSVKLLLSILREVRNTVLEFRSIIKNKKPKVNKG